MNLKWKKRKFERCKEKKKKKKKKIYEIEREREENGKSERRWR